MSKGSNRRPPAVDDKTVADNWAQTFGLRDNETYEVVWAIPCYPIPSSPVDDLLRCDCGNSDCFICDETS